MKKLIFVLIASPFLSIAQQWEMSPDRTIYREVMVLSQQPPTKLDLLIGNYNGSASVKYANDTVTVGNIRWGGTFNGISVNTTLEEAIYKPNGKIRGAWEARIKKQLEASIKRELSFYR